MINLCIIYQTQVWGEYNWMSTYIYTAQYKQIQTHLFQINDQ